MPGHVHLVDDDPSFLTAMERRLKHTGYEVTTYASALHLLVSLPNESVPSCILLDVRIPGVSGPDLQQRLKEIDSTLPIIFLTGYADVATTVRTMKAGADDVLTKPVASKDLLPAVERAIARHQVAHGQKVRLEQMSALVGSLTPCEREVFDLVVRGRINKQIAHELGATERTIKAHRSRVMVKMQIQFVAELVSLAERLGVLGEQSDSPQRA
jgi:FixJ family two-component response regulator